MIKSPLLSIALLEKTKWVEQLLLTGRLKSRGVPAADMEAWSSEQTLFRRCYMYDQ